MLNDAYVNDSLNDIRELESYRGVAVLGEQRDGKIGTVTYELLPGAEKLPKNWGNRCIA